MHDDWKGRKFKKKLYLFCLFADDVFTYIFFFPFWVTVTKMP